MKNEYPIIPAFEKVQKSFKSMKIKEIYKHILLRYYPNRTTIKAEFVFSVF